MNKTTVIISGLVGSAAGLAACLIFFFVVSKPGQTAVPQPTPTPVQSPAPKPTDEIPNPEIKASDVSSVSINTVYKGYFAPGDKCAKSYNEYFGNDDGLASPSSPCTITIKFSRDGKATRSIEISRWDKAAKAKKVIEKTDSAAAVTPEQFDSLAQAIVTNVAFKEWREGTMINVSNCSITVNHSGGVKSVMSNVDERTTAYLPMVKAFQDLEKSLDWKSAH